MVDVTYQMVLSTLQTAGLLVGIIYYISTMRNNQRTQQLQLETRRTQMFMQLHQSKYDQKGLESIFMLMNLEWDDFEDYMQKYGGITGHLEIAAAQASWFDYYDGLGLLVKDDKVDLDMVYSIAYSRILFVWFKFETVLKELRKPPWGMPDYEENFEYLANEMIKIRKQRGLPIPYTIYIHPTSELYKEYNP